MRRDRSLFLRYMALRGTTAAGTLLTGFSQTFVFARVLSPERFSLFIVIGNLGLSLWLFDLGIAKVLFVNLRERYLSGRLSGDDLQLQASAVTLLYAVLVLLGTLGCFALTAMHGARDAVEGMQYALFFCYAALNLVWFVLRNISVAADRFLFFETLEAVRRIGHLALMFCLFLPMPLTLFLVLSNLLWAVLLVVLVGRLRQLGIVKLALGEMPLALWRFFRRHRAALLGSGGYAAGEMYIYNFPSILVPIVHGLGAPTIIFDTAFKIFRGATILFSAACDLLVPRQTKAFAAGDRHALNRATLLALGLGLVPALSLSALLLIAGDPLYRLLLGKAASMPSELTPILVVMILCNLVQTVSNFLLVHTGFFTQIARLAGLMVIVMTGVAAIDTSLRLDIVHFVMLYAAAYLVSAGLYATLALKLPLRVGEAAPPAPGPA